MNVARSWMAMHAIGLAALVWVGAVPVVFAAANSTISPLLKPPGSGSVPTALTVPLLGAAGAAFALQHAAPQLLGMRTRGLAVPQGVWSLLCLLPGAALAAVGAVRADQVTVLSAERNALLLTGMTLIAGLVVPVGLSPLVPLLYEVACLYYAAAANTGLPVPFWAVLYDRVASGPQLTAAAAVCAAGLLLHHAVRDRRRT